MILSAMGAVGTVFLMIGAGLFIHYKKWATRQDATVLIKIVVNIAVPASVIHSFLTRFTRADIFEARNNILAVLAASVVIYLLSVAAARLLKVKKERRGLFSALFAFSNSVFIGFPLAMAVFGEDGMIYAVLYFMVNTTMFWTFGYFGIRKDAALRTGVAEKITLKDTLSRVFSVPLISLFVGFALMMLNVQLPSFLMSTVEYLSGLTSPLSLIFTGIMLADLGLPALKFEWDVVKVLLGRLLIAPGIMLVFGIVFGLSGLGRDVFVVQMTLPVMLQSVILSEYYGADADFATKAFAWTMVLSFISMPAIVLVVNMI
ncbi:MAG: AEC family transporter [Eubacteriales bacterium]